jgi:S1-C subfamily serine protease
MRIYQTRKLEMNKRYAALAPLNAEEMGNLGGHMFNFFSVRRLAQIKPFQAPTVADFIQWAQKEHGEDWNPYAQQLLSILTQMEAAGIVARADNAMFINRRYTAVFEVSNLGSKGVLFFGKAFGAPFIAKKIERDICMISVEAREMPAIGTGTVVGPGLVLTCAHVVQGNNITSLQRQDGTQLPVIEVLADDSLDIAFIKTDSAIEPINKDVAFRSAQVLERVVNLGYPLVPRSIESTLIVHTGEICGQTKIDYGKIDVDLFTSFSRPGNSGGPLLSMDGRIIGIVTQSLEIEVENGLVLPFFASVPSRDIQKVAIKLLNKPLAWEDYS